MIPSTVGAGSEASSAAAPQTSSKHGTLPPPEWKTQKASEPPAPTTAKPLVRRTGDRAEEAWLRARAQEACAADDAVAMYETRTALARWLASRDRDLDEASELAASALQLGQDDAELRRELSAWLESLGEPARAAAVLKPLASLADVDSAEAASVLSRAGLLKARAGAGAAAAAAFEAAQSIDEGDALAGELVAALNGWQPDAVSPSLAVDAYVESARRKAALKQDDAELEDLWSAFTLLATSDKAADALAGSLERRGRHAAADEVLRVHAQALAVSNPPAATRVHKRRRTSAALAREPARALAAALDEGLAAHLEGQDTDALDAILLDLGMLEAVAARLNLKAERAREPRERAAILLELARLHAGPLVDDEGAAAAYVAALAADPTCEEAILALGAWSRAGRASEGHDESPPWAELAASLAGIPEERDRHAKLLGHFRAVFPGPILETMSSEGPLGRAGRRPTLWVHELLGAGPRAQATALERAAESGPEAAKAVFLAVAADRYLTIGNATAARNAAELATRIDPTSTRAVAALADSVLALPRDRGAAPALERAIGMIGPRGTWCFALADTLETLGEADLAAGWSQRCLSLRPWDRDAIELLLDRLLRAGDASRVRDALAWLLTQPQPTTWAGEPFARALSELGRLDPERAVVVARRALDVFGAKVAALREAMLAVAARVSDDFFSIAILERWLSGGVDGTDRRQLLLRLADLRHRIDDDAGEARVLARAVREGFVGPEIDERIERGADRDVGGDALVWRMRANAERLAAGGGDSLAATSARRELGAALWDLADDRVGALEAWERAARIAPGGHACFALDLVEFAGRPFAFQYLTRVVETEPDDKTSAAIAADMAMAALSIGEAQFAFDLSARGLARSAACAPALEAAERSAAQTGELPALSALYELVASRSMGRFGRRAAHYRGARFFERLGEHALALKHAAQAFYAVPSEGATFQSLARAAERAGDRPLAVRAVEHVAELEPEAVVRARWLLCAARIAGEGEDGARRRLDALLRAVTALPSSSAVAALRDAARQLLDHSPEERETLALRLAHASRMIGKRLAGPEGARVSIAFASMLSELFGESDDAMASVERAFACDADLDEYESLMPHVAVLGQAPRPSERVAAMLSTAEQPNSNVGVSVLRLFAAIGAAMGDGTLRARCHVAAALRDPSDDALVIDADAAIRALPELAPRVASAIPPARRAAALESAARALGATDSHGEAAAFFERAADLLTGEARARIERELRAALDAAGRTTDIEARAHREAVSGGGVPSVRADGWTEVAELREGRGDKAGAVAALLEACRLDPDPLERWSALERVAEIAGDDDARIAALQRIETRVGLDGLPTVLKRLARAHERRGNLETAENTWRRVLALDREDDEANQAIQSIIVARGDYSELVDHMALRAERLSADPEKREILRALRLRRAAILEQRLGRVDDACHELEALLRDWPESVGALRYLADLLDRQRDFARSVPLWRRAAELEENPAESSEMELRAESASRGALLLRIEAARALGADADLGDALDAMATTEAAPSMRADFLFEAAQAAARAGDLARGLDRARRAIAVDEGRRRTALHLLAHSLEYRIRGAGAPDEARQTIQELGQIVEPLAENDVALRSFLLAEALDVVQGGGAGLHELEGARGIVGDHPVVAVGLAERFAAQGQDSMAVEAYRAALKGPLVELRRPGAVALAGADAALRAGSTADMTYFLDVAEGHEETRTGAAARRARLTAASESVSRMLASSGGSNVASGENVREVRLYELEAAFHGAKDSVERAGARLALARGRLDFGDTRGAEPLLWEALADGLTEAGDLLAPLIASTPGRSAELVRVRLQLVALDPGEWGRLESLRAAALADDDRVHARAIEHVMRAFDPGAGPLPPPPLAAQPEQPGIVALLMRPAMDGSGEALALLWEGAMQLFVRDAGSYGITGIERVVPGPTSPLGRLYDVAVRVLGVPRIPFFLTRSAGGPLESHVALLSPPSVILSGDVREETAALRYEFGRGVASALPHNVLRSALPRGEGRMVVDALRTAFGPPELGRQVDARVARLAESFWQIVPARGQRRLQELLHTAAWVDYAELVERAQQSARRVGMFLAGDFGWAARALLAESRSQVEDLPSIENLRDLCASVPALADLLCLAVRPEYADARWHTVASASQRRTASSGRFSLF